MSSIPGLVLTVLAGIAAVLIRYNVVAAKEGEVIGWLFATIWALVVVSCGCELVIHAGALTIR